MKTKKHEHKGYKCGNCGHVFDHYRTMRYQEYAGASFCEDHVTPCKCMTGNFDEITPAEYRASLSTVEA